MAAIGVRGGDSHSQAAKISQNRGTSPKRPLGSGAQFGGPKMVIFDQKRRQKLPKMFKNRELPHRGPESSGA